MFQKSRALEFPSVTKGGDESWTKIENFGVRIKESADPGPDPSFHHEHFPNSRIYSGRDRGFPRNFRHDRNGVKIHSRGKAFSAPSLAVRSRRYPAGDQRPGDPAQDVVHPEGHLLERRDCVLNRR